MSIYNNINEIVEDKSKDLLLNFNVKLSLKTLEKAYETNGFPKDPRRGDAWRSSYEQPRKDLVDGLNEALEAMILKGLIAAIKSLPLNQLSDYESEVFKKFKEELLKPYRELKLRSWGWLKTKEAFEITNTLIKFNQMRDVKFDWTKVEKLKNSLELYRLFKDDQSLKNFKKLLKEISDFEESNPKFALEYFEENVDEEPTIKKGEKRKIIKTIRQVATNVFSKLLDFAFEPLEKVLYFQIKTPNIQVWNAIRFSKENEIILAIEDVQIAEKNLISFNPGEGPETISFWPNDESADKW